MYEQKFRQEKRLSCLNSKCVNHSKYVAKTFTENTVLYVDVMKTI